MFPGSEGGDDNKILINDEHNRDNPSNNYNYLSKVFQKKVFCIYIFRLSDFERLN